uniref:MFS transporter n=1 Tax=Alistipes megaguti TaxID=2364787 RepID=UPI000EFCA38E|nr:MFS transporter [Alistipes megaguti]
MTPEQNKRFKHWQMRTILATMIGYALFYFVRKNFSLAMPGLEADLGISKVSLGIFLTLNGIIYGLSRFVNGILADRMNARWYMAIGLALCALSNFAFGFGEDISYWITGEHTGDRFTNTMILFMGIMWMVNGLLQGSGFPPCARLLTHWIPPTELATKMSLWNTSHSIGAGLVVILCGYIMGHLGQNLSADPEAVARIAANLGIESSDSEGMATVMSFAAHFGAWRWCFWIPSAIAFAGAIGLVFSLRDTPSSVGLPELEGTEVSSAPTTGSSDRKGSEYKAFLMKHVFRNPLIWTLGVANFFVYVVRFSVLDWGPSLLSQSKGVSMAHAGWLVAMFEIAGILGMLFAGWVTDRWLKGRAHRTCVFCMAGAALFVFLFWQLPADAPIWLLFATLCAAGFCIYGPQALIGIAAANQATKKAAATANGLTGLFGYASTLVSGVGLGFVAQHYGWNWAYVGILGMALVGMGVFLLMWGARADGYSTEANAEH